MRSFWINAFFFLNLIGIAMAIPFTVAANSESFTVSGIGLLAVISIIDVILFLPAFWILGTSNKLPRRTYLPLLLGYLIPYLTVGLLPGWVDVALNVIYLAVAIYCMKQRANLTGKFLGVIPKEYIAREHRARSRFLPVLACMLTGFLLVAVVGVYRAVDFFVREGAEDVLKLKWDGIYTKTQTYAKDDQVVKVFSMLHFGDRAFYQKMFEQIPKENTLVLLEGVKDRAKFLGEGRPHDETMFGIPSQFGIFNPKVEREREYLDADIDVIDLSPEVRAYKVDDARRGSLSKIAFASKEERAKITRLNQRSKDERNAHLMAEFDKYSSSYKTVVFTWGAGHTGYIAKALQERGYTLASESEERAISFW
ncbi:MAG: hypothetical protein H7318_12010 [Oligoflexus sp.]|nr:hypothetical protein [Oligoflexus sp.]